MKYVSIFGTGVFLGFITNPGLVQWIILALAASSLATWLYIRGASRRRSNGIPRFYPDTRAKHPSPICEKAILMRMIVEPDCIPIVTRLLRPESFASLQEQNAFLGIVAVFQQAGTPTLPIHILVKELANRNQWTLREAKQFLDALLDNFDEDDYVPCESFSERRKTTKRLRRRDTDPTLRSSASLRRTS